MLHCINVRHISWPFSHSLSPLSKHSSITCRAHHHQVLWSLQHEQETADGPLRAASQLGIQSLHFTLPFLLQLLRNDLREEALDITVLDTHLVHATPVYSGHCIRAGATCLKLLVPWYIWYQTHCTVRTFCSAATFLKQLVRRSHRWPHSMVPLYTANNKCCATS